MTPILEVKQLVKKYGDLTAVNGISFNIEQGEIFSLLGPNGAGKTTTISVLSTLFAPTSGDVTIAGHSVTAEPMQVRRVIGVVPQEIALYDDLTARENLAFWGQMYGLSGKGLSDRVEQVLKEIDLTDRAKDRVRTFSGGMKRRVNIGVGLLHRPKLLFMDEPTVGIDPQSRRAILDSVKMLNRQGMTVLYTTHYMEEAQELSDRVGIVDHGELIAIGTQEELTRQIGEKDALILDLVECEAIAALTEAARKIPGVQQVDLSECTLTVLAAQAEDVLAPVIAQANALNVKIRSVSIQEPNLEAVFLHLTGRALRD
ncbi:MAG TPA: ATP-binding cassette domain-containing protein [Anaerolineaceae bacterium]